MKLFSLFFLSLIFISQSFSKTNQELSGREIKNILKLALDFPDLQQYYHVDQLPSRCPIVIQEFGPINAKNIEGLSKFGEQVVVLNSISINANSTVGFIGVSDWKHSSDKVNINLYYPAEGLIMEYKFEKLDGVWHIGEAQIHETAFSSSEQSKMR